MKWTTFMIHPYHNVPNFHLLYKSKNVLRFFIPKENNKKKSSDSSISRQNCPHGGRPLEDHTASSNSSDEWRVDPTSKLLSHPHSCEITKLQQRLHSRVPTLRKINRKKENKSSINKFQYWFTSPFFSSSDQSRFRLDGGHLIGRLIDNEGGETERIAVDVVVSPAFSSLFFSGCTNLICARKILTFFF